MTICNRHTCRMFRLEYELMKKGTVSDKADFREDWFLIKGCFILMSYLPSISSFIFSFLSLISCSSLWNIKTFHINLQHGPDKQSPGQDMYIKKFFTASNIDQLTHIHFKPGNYTIFFSLSILAFHCCASYLLDSYAFKISKIFKLLTS